MLLLRKVLNTNMTVILVIILILIILDIYLKIAAVTRTREFTGLQADIINTALVNKGILKRDDLDKAREEVLSKLTPEQYEVVKKRLEKLGVGIEKNQEIENQDTLRV